MGKRILINSENFYPLRGGGEKHLEQLLQRLISDGFEIEVITVIPEIEGYEKDFDYPVHRIIKGKVSSEELNGLSVSDFIWGSEISYASNYFRRNNPNLSNIKQINNSIKEFITKSEKFDIYIGVGQFGAKLLNLDSEEGDIPKFIKEINPQCKTFYLEYDIYHFTNPHGDKINISKWDYVDYILCLNGLEMNHSSIKNENEKIYVPPEIIKEIYPLKSLEEWESRPYDFGFVSPLYHKGNSIVRSLLIDYPNSKFLIKKPSYSSSYDLEVIYPMIANNYDVLGWVEDMDKDFYQKCKFILYPSLNEGYGMVSAEAICNGSIPIINDTQSNRWVNANFAYYIDNELKNNSILYNFDYYMENYLLVNNSWNEEIKNILKTSSKEHYRFIKQSQEGVLSHHQQRFEMMYDKFVSILRGAECENIVRN